MPKRGPATVYKSRWDRYFDAYRESALQDYVPDDNHPQDLDDLLVVGQDPVGTDVEKPLDKIFR